MEDFISWGKFPRVSQEVTEIAWRDEAPAIESGTCLPYGRGRSYGDSCLNDGGTIISTRRLNHLIHFDQTSGLLRCEAGVSIDQILAYAVPRGWFIPVTPGTQYVTVGGALANDVHGKNHHRGGTFGRYVPRFELVRSNGERFVCSAEERSEMYRATIGGLGLTGLITWLDLQLIPIESPYIDVDSIKFSNLDEFFQLSGSSDEKYEYTVSWIDCVSGGDAFGRGIFMGGNHLTSERAAGQAIPRCQAEQEAKNFLSVPFNFPNFALNEYSIRAFNTLYYGKQRAKHKNAWQHYRPFFYPLDSIACWNRIYGKRGFLQFQCVIPPAVQRPVIEELLREIVASGQASFLAVMKEFGDIQSPGMLSFPKRGTTLTLDFAHRGPSTLDLMKTLDDIVAANQGRLYPAKDATMSAAHFQQYYPNWKEFSDFIDPSFSSSFWRRVTGHKEK